MALGGGRELRAGNRDGAAARRYEQIQALGIEVSEDLVLQNRSADISTPLIGVHERPRNTASVVEPAVGIERTAVPIVGVFPVPLIGAALGDERDVCTRQRAVFT